MGSGMAHSEMGWVTAIAYFDREQLELQNRDAEAGRTVYPKTDEKQFDVIPGEFLFTTKYSQEMHFGTQETNRFLPLTSSLNGLGADAAALFPDDEEFQMVAIMNQIEYMGVSGEKKIYNDRTETGGGRDDFNFQLHGNTSQPAVVDTPPGVPLILVPPRPGSLGDESRVIRADTDSRKAILEAVPYNIETVLDSISAHLRRFIHDTETYKKVLDPVGNYRKVGAWFNFMYSQQNTDLNTILFGIYYLKKKGVLDISLRDGTAFDFKRAGANLTAEELVTGMARNFGLLEGAYDSIPNVKAESFRDEFLQLAREIMATVHYDGFVANFGFGFNEVEKRNPYILENGEIKRGSSFGTMLFNQLNHHLAHISATNDALLREWSRIVGTCYEGGEKGYTMHLLLKK
jgi:hypothetical protein